MDQDQPDPVDIKQVQEHLTRKQFPDIKFITFVEAPQVAIATINSGLLSGRKPTEEQVVYWGLPRGDLKPSIAITSSGIIFITDNRLTYVCTESTAINSEMTLQAEGAPFVKIKGVFTRGSIRDGWEWHPELFILMQIYRR